MRQLKEFRDFFLWCALYHHFFLKKSSQGRVVQAKKSISSGLGPKDISLGL